jgi:hypothetical protein
VYLVDIFHWKTNMGGRERKRMDAGRGGDGGEKRGKGGRKV